MAGPAISLSQQNIIAVTGLSFWSKIPGTWCALFRTSYHQRRHIAMRVPHQDHIDSRNLSGDRNRRVFVRHLGWATFAGAQIFFDAHVHRDHDDIDFTNVAEYLYPLLCLAYGFLEL